MPDMKTVCHMSEQEWADAVARFGLSDEEAGHYREAFAEVETFGLERFIDQVFNEAVAAVKAQRAGFPPTAGCLQRLQARKTVVIELAGGEEVVVQQLQQLALASYDGPTH